LILTFTLKGRFNEGLLHRGKDLQTHDPLKDSDLREQLLAHGQGEADASALAIVVLGGGVMLKAGETFMEPQEWGKVLVARLGDEVEHRGIAFDEGAGPAAEPTKIGIGVEIKKMSGLKAVRRGFKAQEVPDVAGTPASDGGDDLEGIGSLFVEPGAVAALSAAGAGSIQALISGIGLTEAQADEDRGLSGVNMLTEPGLSWPNFEVAGAPAEFGVRRGQATHEHLGEEAAFWWGGNINGVQGKGTASGEGGSAPREASISIEHGGVFHAGIGMDQDDLFDEIGVLGGEQQGARSGSGGVFATATHHRKDASALLEQAGEGEVSVFDAFIEFRSHRYGVYLICKPLSSAGEGTKITTKG